MRRFSAFTLATATVIAGLMVLLALPAGALGLSTEATIRVLNPPGSSDPVLKVPCGASIQAAINAAHSGDTIVLARCTYSPSRGLTVDKSVTISGAGVGETIILGPADIGRDAFGNPWTIEIGNAATVTLSGFTLVVAPQCIIYPGPRAVPLIAYAGGGIGVGGTAVLHLSSAMVTTTGLTEGAACGGPSLRTAGEVSYGTGVDFGLDYVTGSPAAHELVGSGSVTGVVISGFGYGGPGISVGGQADSPAGSHAVIRNDQVTTSVDDVLHPHNSPAITLGFGGNVSTATIVDNVVSGLPGVTNAIFEYGESSAYIAHNLVLASGGPGGNGIVVDDSSSATIASNAIVVVGPGGDGITVAFSSWATILSNEITANTSTYAFAGIVLLEASAAISYNSISDMECEFNPADAAPYTCGPDYATQDQGYGIVDYSDAGFGTTIEHNLISDNDVGIELAEGCPACVVSHNTLIDNLDYGLAGIDGDYTFLHNSVIGGMYAVAAIAYSVDTKVMLHHVEIVAPSVGLFYFEVDFSGGTATVVGK